MKLQRVSELRILHIGKVVFVCVFETFHFSSLISPFVFPDANITVHNRQHGRNDGCDEGGEETRPVSWGIFFFEE